MDCLKKTYYSPLLVLFLAIITSIVSFPVAAQGGIELSCQYPVVRGSSGTAFEFQVNLKYEGNETRSFDLFAQGPAGWHVLILPAYGQTPSEIRAITLEPGKTYPDTIKIALTPSLWALPEPGEYIVTVKASAGQLKDEIELKAVVTAKYELNFKPAAERYNINATAGEDSHFSVRLTNTGTADISKITFSSEKPGGWEITFIPEEVDSLGAGTWRDIDAVISPPRKTIAGDYQVTLRVSSQEASDWMDIRVTVLTPTIWGWVGAGIVVAVIVALGIIFVRLGRR